MSQKRTTVKAHPNIAFIKYWGNAIPDLRLPSNGSISMNLHGLDTVTSLTENKKGAFHSLEINGEKQDSIKTKRISAFIEKARELYGFSGYLDVRSQNNFPMGAGIASSASAFAALATALNDFYALDLSEKEISALARLGSGSACRSIPDGFTMWKTGTTHEGSYATSIVPVNHWELYDYILIVNKDEKKISSTEGHHLSATSPFQSVRIHDAKRRLEICKSAILDKDFEKLSDIIELDSDMMHAVMMTSNPPITYWQPDSIAIMKKVRALRKRGIACAYTMDAGPNVHVICTASDLNKVKENFKQFKGIDQALLAKTGFGARVIQP